MDTTTALQVWTSNDPAWRKDPYPAYAALHRAGAVHRVDAEEERVFLELHFP